MLDEHQRVPDHVRGAFDGLTSDQRAELPAEAGAHDISHSEFTAEGHGGRRACDHLLCLAQSNGISAFGWTGAGLYLTARAVLSVAAGALLPHPGAAIACVMAPWSRGDDWRLSHSSPTASSSFAP